MALTSKELIARLSPEKQQRVLAKKTKIHAMRVSAKRLPILLAALENVIKPEVGHVQDAH
ncbi:MAG: hypothetical protein U0989_06635 [Azonexus sp.]|nr:hypothetical protein [Azonexus sp.]MDZ4314426.1 hypothetical protein [Azonexus sp.]